MSTENPLVSNFLGLGGFQDLMADVEIEIDDHGEKQRLTKEQNLLRVEEASIPILGISVLVPGDTARFNAAAKAANLPIEYIDVVVIAEDRFLKEREIVKQSALASFAGSNEIVKRKSFVRPRALQNSREGLRLEIAFVLNRHLDVMKGRPHRLGTKLAAGVFRVRGFPSSGGINPTELKLETIKAKKLSRKTQIYVDVQDDLMAATSIADAVVVYVDGELLKALKKRRSGIEYDYIGTSLAVGALQQIVFAISKELNRQPEFLWGEEEVPVLEFLRSKLNEVKRVGAGDFSQDETVVLLRDEPGIAASLLTGLLTFTGDARKLLLDGLDGEV